MCVHIYTYISTQTHDHAYIQIHKHTHKDVCMCAMFRGCPWTLLSSCLCPLRIVIIGMSNHTLFHLETDSVSVSSPALSLYSPILRPQSLKL